MRTQEPVIKVHRVRFTSIHQCHFPRLFGRSLILRATLKFIPPAFWVVFDLESHPQVHSPRFLGGL